MKRIFTVVLLITFGCAAHSIEIIGVDVERTKGRFVMNGESVIEAPPEFVHSILSDFEDFHHIAGGIEETRYVEDGETGEQLGYTRINSCVLFFCKTIEKIETIRSEPGELFLTTAIPERSDFDFFLTRWTLRPDGEHTNVRYHAIMEPEFWVPPGLGTWAISRALRVSAIEMGSRIEYLYTTGRPLSSLAKTRDD